MDLPSGANTPRARSRAFSSSISTPALARPRSERDLRDGASITNSDARSSVSIPKAFEGMLKTTTETGDIGMFSIKPSRVPSSGIIPRRISSYNEPGLQRPHQSFQPYGMPDDRRRLPSYARDTTSELISMYETPSQKSSRVFDDSDYRSYSMTQTSAYTLSNHRSYTSLRSQPEGNGLLQRPRSPFAYPTRLKRPGFRPSSPALTDGGAVDYRRRAEIDRMTYGGHSTASPSSLYAQKRIPPPLSLRAEGNRSTPSLLSQTSPTRRSSSPLVHQINGNSGNDWPRRMGPASVNTSPARSTLSLTSTVNLGQANLPPSTTTTPGKVSTPLYYDYTEEFEVEEYSQPIVREPPPQFRIDSTIPEDRPMSAEGPTLVDSYARNARDGLKTGLRVSSSAASIQQIHDEASQEVDLSPANSQTQWPVRKTSLPLHNEHSPTEQVEIPSDKKVFRLSRLGYGAQELNNHVAEAFGLAPSASFEMMDPKKDGHVESGGQAHAEAACGGNDPQPSARVGPSDLQLVATSQEANRVARSEDNIAKNNVQDQVRVPSHSEPLLRSSMSQRSIDRHAKNQRRASSLDFTSGRTKRPRSSGYNSVNTGFTEIAELISSLENANRAQSPEKQDDNAAKSSGRNSRLSPSIPIQVKMRRASPDHVMKPPTSVFNQGSSSSKQINDNARTNAQRQRLKQPPFRPREHISDTMEDYGLGDVPNFSHQIPAKSVSRSGSPMLAPKPISPARQLKLKNSVPQLMKALPPVPPEPQFRAVPPPEHMMYKTRLPFSFSPLLPESRASVARDLPPIPEPESSAQKDSSAQQVNLTETTEGALKSLPSAPATSGTSKENPTFSSSPPKLKLKGRGAAALASRSLNSEENPPGLKKSQDDGAPSAIQEGKPKTSGPPKFKLKVTRASNSTQGTVRINRESEDWKLTGLRNPKDLFTPSAGIDNIFRHVSKHLHTRKSSANSSHGTTETVSSARAPNQTDGSGTRNIPSNGPPTTSQSHSSDVRSFFSDASSNMQGRHSLRKRISNFKARIGVPYSTRVVSHSLEDIPLRSRHHSSVSRSPAAQSVPNLHFSDSSTEDTPRRRPRERVSRMNLKEKLSRWLKGARSAIAARVRSRNSTGEVR